MTSPAGAAKLIVAMWILAVGLIVYDSQRRGETLPPAYRFGGAAIVYSFLIGVAQFSPAAPLAGVFALAWTFGLGWRVQTGTSGKPLPHTFAPAPSAQQTAQGG